MKLSDADAFNWTAIEVLSILVFLLVLVRVAYMPGADVGTIFAIFVYVWRLMEKLDMMPQIVQQLMRLKDIRRRIEAGASAEAIGERDRAHRAGQEWTALMATGPSRNLRPAPARLRALRHGVRLQPGRRLLVRRRALPPADAGLDAEDCLCPACLRAAAAAQNG